ncbi:sugar transferase [uncultured Ruminococcus sp.]|uniref:sugar transferase n=1 Tax=uncultured Ruminococcus sp. TaxID=165186 RepID=UPI0025EB8BA1|nr:sugar transferase [uncultured Ruminococcus sp.]
MARVGVLENNLREIEFKNTNDEKIELETKPVYSVLKRLGDIVLSLTALILLSPFLLIISLLIMIEDRHSPFYVQSRVGLNGKTFNIYKFRTMGANSDSLREELKERNEDQGANFKMSDDPRVTRIGAFLRKYSIDELLQLFNILKSDMSIIGPRPFIAEEQVELPDDRLLVKPGLSCYWQIFGKNDLTKEEQIELDRKYIRERSVKTDIKILWKTVFCVIGAKNC